MRIWKIVGTVLLAGLIPGVAESQTAIERCAVGGAHLEGCGLSPASCTFGDFLAGTCPVVAGTTVQVDEPAPAPEPTPAPEPELAPEPVPAPSVLPPAPTALLYVDGAMRFTHAGTYTEWYTLRIDGAYHAHVGMSANVDGLVSIPFDSTLPAGTYTVAVDACGGGGCARSDAVTVTR